MAESGDQWAAPLISPRSPKGPPWTIWSSLQQHPVDQDWTRKGPLTLQLDIGDRDKISTSISGDESIESKSSCLEQALTGRPQMACSCSDVSRTRQSSTSSMPGCYRASVITFVSRNYDALETSKEEKRDLAQ
ncbi:hypothetical protein WN51_07455 [Melipona quadrifasciata]|uniref:Uncharacterized protein n=1 Tax=Melipona quadrifasciata TaxID=166423 RepID=A0A0N0U6R5_9HYME|nr:hypothetical protein WN51_07455 [Melipona quadrifasciata]